MQQITYDIDSNGCWNCTSHKAGTDGYPKAMVNKKNINVHRAVYFQKTGKVLTSKIVVRHTCDNRLCINPEHLIEGTNADNVADRVLRDRSAKGAINGRAKLDDKKVLAIKNSNKGNSALASEYGVDRKVIYDIKKGKMWKHVKLETNK